MTWNIQKKMKQYLINRYLKNIFNEYELYLVNFTFSDDYLSHSTYSERLKYIKKFLDEHCRKYIAGQNFSNLEREYYVCICNSKIPYTEYKYKVIGKKIGRVSPAAYHKYFMNDEYVIWK